jgi:hypothetical protein
MAGIERRLPAAGLRFGIIHLVSEPFQHLHDAHPDLRIKLIHETRNEQRDFHAARSGLDFYP